MGDSLITLNEVFVRGMRGDTDTVLRSRLPLALLVTLLAVVAFGSTASAGGSGTIVSQSGWRTIATLGTGVVEQRETVNVSGYGDRTLTRISWTIGTRGVRLDAGPVVPGGYDPRNHSFREGRISSYAPSVGAVSGMNGDTYCPGCAPNGNDTLHGLLVHARLIYAFGSGPEVGYTAGGGMIMGSARAVPAQLSFATGPATIAVWNALTLPGGSAIGTDQVAVYTTAGKSIAVPATDVALALAGKAVVAGVVSTPHAVIAHLLRAAVPYADSHDQIVGPVSHHTEWVDAYRIGQTGGTASTATLPVTGTAVTGGSITVPAGGVVLIARATGSAGAGVRSAATSRVVKIRVDDAGWSAAPSIIDGKYQMVKNGVARTSYPGWPDSWPWTCQGVGSGCVRAVIATANHNQGWMIIVTGPGGTGLTMPDYARVLRQIGATNVMGFDSNTHADLWARGAQPITAGNWEPGAPEATTLHAR